MIRGTYGVRFESDWHIGSGLARTGGVGNLVKREQGLPIVPAKTMTGIWRDAAEMLAAGLDDGSPDGTWQMAVEELFGQQPSVKGSRSDAEGPRPALLRVRTARLADGLAELLRTSEPHVGALTAVRPGVRIDAETGAALDKHLRLVEVARHGLELHGSWELSVADDRADVAHQLLVASAALIRSLGGGRRRGLGRCRVDVCDASATLLTPAAAAQGLRTARAPSLLAEPDRALGLGAPAHHPLERCDLDLRVRLREPVLAAGVVHGNVVTTRTYIPGSLLLPAIMRTLRDDGHRDIVAALSAAIPDRRLRCCDATPTVDGLRGVPAPQAIAVEKDGAGSVNRLYEPPPDRQHKALHRGFVGASARDPKLPQTVSFTHNTITDDLQRPTSDQGGVYSYVALDRGQELMGRLSCDGLDPKVAERLARVLNGASIRIGRAKKDEYGDAQLAVTGTALSRADDAPVTHAPSVSSPDDATAGELTVWLRSDALLLDERLRPQPTLARLARVLSDELGAVLEAPELKDPSGPLVAVGRAARHESWHAGWQLPRPSLVTLAAGTCVRMTIDRPVTVDRLRDVERRGIGARTAEGYGELLFDDARLTGSTLPEAGVAGERPRPSQSLSSVDEALLAEFDRDVVRAAIVEAVEALVVDEGACLATLGFKTAPTNAQLGALRNAVSVPADELVASLERFIAGLRATAARSEQWPPAAEAALRSLPGQVWERLGLDERLDMLVLAGESPVDELALPATRSLLMACIRRLARVAGETPT